MLRRLKRQGAIGAGLAVVGLTVFLVAAASSQEDGSDELSGPFTHRNLSIFLIHGPNQVDGAEFITLQEAMDKGLVTVHETGNVGQLTIENRSKQASVFIQSGDIVKGGRQDRTLAYDVVVPPNSDRMPIKSFCVESGRWTNRGNESAAQFASNTNMLASRKLKLAAKEQGSQGAVWSSVAETQAKLSHNLNTEVRSGESQTSLQLTLESEDLARVTKEYEKALGGIVKDADDAIGFAFAINGEVNSIDTYASAGIFKRLWPKLLHAAVVEAIAELDPDSTSEAPTAEDVQAVMASADAAAEQETREIGAGVAMNTRQADETVVFETVDRERDGVVLHKNYIVRPADDDPAPPQPNVRQEVDQPQAEQLQQQQRINRIVLPEEQEQQQQRQQRQ